MGGLVTDLLVVDELVVKCLLRKGFSNGSYLCSNLETTTQWMTDE